MFPLSVIWCSPKLAKGADFGQNFHAANPAPASSNTATPAQMAACDFFAAGTAGVLTAAAETSLLAVTAPFPPRPLDDARTATPPPEDGGLLVAAPPPLAIAASPDAATFPDP